VGDAGTARFEGTLSGDETLQAEVFAGDPEWVHSALTGNLGTEAWSDSVENR
jgi:hypothetical protein